MNLVKIISTIYDVKNRITPKFLRMGLHDVQTANVAAPYGIDSNPIKDIIAVYSATGENGRPVILGYINVAKASEPGQEQFAEPGELRLFSTNDEGVQQIYLWLKNNGTIELGGASRHLVKYEELDAAIQQMATDINTELAKIAVVLNGLSPGSYTPTIITPDLSASQSTKLKTS